MVRVPTRGKAVTTGQTWMGTGRTPWRDEVEGRCRVRHPDEDWEMGETQ